MDIFAHGLWTNVIYAKAQKKNRLMAVVLGVTPDILSFGIFFVIAIWSGFKFGPPDGLSVPAYVSMLYNLWHSLFTWLLIFAGVWLVFKKPFWPLLAPLIHIVIDVPLHDVGFFPTPFLWPVSDYKFNGISWGVGWFMIVNYSVMVLAYLTWYFFKRRNLRRLGGHRPLLPQP